MAWNNENYKRRFLISAGVRWLFAGLCYWLPVPVIAVGCTEWVGKAISLQGTVEFRNDEVSPWQPVVPDQTFCGAETIRVLEYGRVAIQLRQDATNFQLGENSALTLPPPVTESSRWLELLKGAVHFLSRTPSALKIKAPFVNAHIEGTEFLVRTERDQTEVWVFAGRVSAENPLGQVSLAAGEKAVASANQAPRKYLLVRPRDSVEWAVYYPPVIDLREAERSWRAELHPAIRHIRQGDLSVALELLERMPEQSRDARYQVLRAAALLNSGRVDETERALGLLPPEGEWIATADAMRSVIALARNDKAAALQLARRATQRADSSASYIALSYAEQGRFDIARALEAAQQAVRVAPKNGLAWARVAELELESGQRSQALEAAHKAAAFDPQLARVQALLGFAALSNADFRLAEGRFDIAIRLDPADPLPRLGKGLAQIRKGQLEEGTRSLAVAAILDPERSLTRSYLGKAYYEKNKSAWAQQEFETAKQLDPQDPTPWLYSALSLQAANRPVEALRNMQQSIERNDNRAVYRSRLLLDDDRASRNSGLGRIFTDLGLQQSAVVEAAKSISNDPANSSAHRLLSDSFNGQPRFELARSSSLLQARLLQPLNSNPVRPSRSGSDLSIAPITGFADSGYNEFSPMFERNRLRFLGSAFGGTQGAVGEEAVLSGLINNLAVSLGQLHIQNEGFRPNSDFAVTKYNFSGQSVISRVLGLHGEYLYDERDEGDMRQQINGLEPGVTRRQFMSRSGGRIGFNLQVNAQSNVLLSYLAGGLRETRAFTLVDELGINLLVRNIESTQRLSGVQFDGQYLYHSDLINLVAGGNYYDISVEPQTTFSVSVVPRTGGVESNNPVLIPVLSKPFGRIEQSAYAYGYVHTSKNILWTLGASYQNFVETKQRLRNNIYPAFGLQWNVFEDMQARFAYFGSSRPSVMFEQSLHPQQVAGFTMYFDDPIGTHSRRFGGALDGHFLNSVYFGFEGTRRDMDSPFYNSVEQIYETIVAHELDYHAYLHFMPHEWLMLSGDLRFNRYVLDDFVNTATNRVGFRDSRVVTLSAKSFSSGGWFGLFAANWVDQEVGLTDKSSALRSAFVTLDAGIGYRLPRRLGMLSVKVTNLLDQRFSYEDDSFRTQISPVSNVDGLLPDISARSSLSPSRTFVAGITVSW